MIAPEMFETRVPRELLPFILPEIDLDSVDVPDAMKIELSSIPSPVDSGKGSDLEETDPVRADNFYTHKEIEAAEAAEALLFAVTDANKPSAPTHPSDQDRDLTFFPWSGVTSTGITMTNTCPLDNWLMIFQALDKSGKVTLTDLTESGHIIANALQLIDSGLFADAKLVILQALTPRPQIVFQTLDLYGNESDFFLTLLSPYLVNSTVTTCSSNFCPAPVNTVKSTSIILPLPTGNHSGENVFSHSLTAWLFPGDSQCGRKFINKPTEDVLFYEDATLNENGDAHVSWYCAGIRTSTARTMLNLKSFIIFSVDLSRGGVLKLSRVTPQIVLFGQNFNLLVQHFGMVYTTSAPFILTMAGFCMMALGNIHKKAVFSSGPFTELPGYSLSYLIYCK